MNIWLSGENSYEISGVESLLAEQSVRGVFRFYPESQIIPGDIMILCFSDVLLMGWWKHLKRAQYLVARYDIKVIVLCPASLYTIDFICDDYIILLNGETNLTLASESLIRALQIRKRGCAKGINRNKNIREFWTLAFMCLQEQPEDKCCYYLVRQYYNRRLFLLKKLKFSSLHIFRVFVSGYGTEQGADDHGCFYL